MNDTNESKLKVTELDLNDILPNRFQPRIKFNEELIIELSQSIKEHGVLQPIIVRPIGDKYEIVAGERRYKASAIAGLSTIPAIILDLNDKDSVEYALIENVQRKDLSPIEEAISYKKILDMGYLTQEQLADKLGKSQSAIANKKRLLNLCDEVQEALIEEKISERHARSLLKIEKASLQKDMLNKIIKTKMTVRQLDAEIEKVLKVVEEEKVDDDLPNNIEVKNNTDDLKENISKEDINLEFDSEKIGDNISNKLTEETINDLNIELPAEIGIDIEESKREIGENDKMLNDIQINENYDNRDEISTSSGKFFKTPVETESKKETIVHEPKPVFDFATGKVSTPSSDNSKANNTFSGSFGDLLAKQGSSPIFDDSSLNQDKIFVSANSNSDSNFNFSDSIDENPDNTVTSEQKSIFSNLINNNPDVNPIDKNSLDKFLDPTFVDGEKHQVINNNDEIGNSIFSKFIDEDFNGELKIASQNEPEKSESNILFNNVNTGNEVPLLKEAVDRPMNVQEDNILSHEKKPDLLAPMNSIAKSDSLLDNQIEKNSNESLKYANNLEPEPLTGPVLLNEQTSRNLDLTPDSTFTSENDEERSDISPIIFNNDSTEKPIFVNATADSEVLTAPKTPIITNIDMSNLLSIREEPDNNSIEPLETSVDTSTTTIAESANIPTTNNNFMTAEDIQPIIITDYNKQYDPILPISSASAAPTIDFKHILNLIRNLNDEIESYGYEIDTEEIDLQDKYQVIFNIVKK